MGLIGHYLVPKGMTKQKPRSVLSMSLSLLGNVVVLLLLLLAKAPEGRGGGASAGSFLACAFQHRQTGRRQPSFGARTRPPRRGSHAASRWHHAPRSSTKRTEMIRMMNQAHNTLPRDVVVIGGGLAGLSAALALSTAPYYRHVTILDRDAGDDGTAGPSSGSFAAAGMLAPQSERLPKGPLLDLCLSSRDMYPDFVGKVEQLAREAGAEGSKHYTGAAGGAGARTVTGGKKDAGADSDSDSCDLHPWEVGFRASGGFLAPAFAGDNVATWAPPSAAGTARWLDEIQVRELEPHLHPDVVGGWWFPEDASVDARRLTRSLRAACHAAGCSLYFGEDYAATALELKDGSCTSIRLKDGRNLAAKAIIVASGAWMRELLPVPVAPHKGQSFSLRMPPGQPPLLSRVLFAETTYIVPKADGRIIVGATVEPGTFDAYVTPGGLMHCMSNAVALVPGLAHLPLEEVWSGLRPTTPDKAPIIGKTSWDNLYLAGGYWRNGVLLAPKTGQLLADLVCGTLNTDDEKLLDSFAWERFITAKGGGDISVQSRYAASIHPVQSRSKGFGISAAVGTELGAYSNAADARDERKKERATLSGTTQERDDAFERAAMMGVEDALSFTSGPGSEEGASASYPDDDLKEDADIESSSGVDASSATNDSGDDSTTDGGSDLSALYAQIQQNKAATKSTIQMIEDGPDVRPEFEFRIYQIDEKTGEKRLVPPYTNPADFEADVKTKERAQRGGGAEVGGEMQEPDETTFDGYVDIQVQNGGATRKEQLEAMRIARTANRLGTAEIDETKIGARQPDD